jgi:plastocyanin
MRGSPLAIRLVAALTLATLIGGCDVFAAQAPALRLQVGTAAGDFNAFDPDELSAPADTLVAIDFTNSSAVEHNLIFVGAITARSSELVEPGSSDSFQFQTPGAGEYRFVCTVHEEMTGRLTVH